MHSKHYLMQSAVKVFYGTCDRGCTCFFNALFSMTGGGRVLAMKQLLRNVHVTSNRTGGLTLSTSLMFPFKVGASFSCNFHKSSIILTLTKDFNKSALME